MKAISRVAAGIAFIIFCIFAIITLEPRRVYLPPEDEMKEAAQDMINLCNDKFPNPKDTDFRAACYGQLIDTYAQSVKERQGSAPAHWVRTRP